ncbi:MAG: hypothetical protein GY696_38465 [Gammaproteobacteria bacterium]|nr:hypothetical protein [Gammaproteobacteria bacterium]
MARRLGEELQTVTMHDNLSNSEIVFTYRMPTTKERTDYQNMAVQRKRNKVTFENTKARQKFGMEILMGIRDGDFEIKKDGDYVLISSSQASEHYDPNWKQHVEEHAIDLVQLLAAHVFDASAEVDDQQD